MALVVRHEIHRGRGLTNLEHIKAIAVELLVEP